MLVSYTSTVHPRPPLLSQQAPIKELDDEATKLGYSIVTNHKNLIGTLEKHGATLIGRWDKSNKNKREALLKQAYPKIPSKPVLDTTEATKYTGEEYQTACLFPAINLMDLTHEEMLIYFLYNRFAAPPSDFAHAELFNTGFDFTLYKESSSNLKSRVLFDHTAPRYGLFVPATALQTRTYELSKALHIVRIQDHVYRFAIGICGKILHDMETLNLNPAGPILDPSMSGAGLWPIVQYIHVTAKFRKPDDLDLSACEPLAVAQILDAIFHLGQLRHDPNFFCEATKCMIEPILAGKLNLPTETETRL